MNESKSVMVGRYDFGQKWPWTALGSVQAQPTRLEVPSVARKPVRWLPWVLGWLPKQHPVRLALRKEGLWA